MIKRPISIRAPRNRQGGMTLLVGMILLLMLSVLSTIGFRNTTLSERMTGNSYDRNISFQSAESAGKEALTVIENGLFVAGTLGHYGAPGLAQGGTTSFWSQGDGVSPFNCATDAPFKWAVGSCAASVATKYAGNDRNAQYVIELLTVVPSGSNFVRTYRVTSRSTGGSGNADVVLQTIYSRTSP